MKKQRPPLAPRGTAAPTAAFAAALAAHQRGEVELAAEAYRRILARDPVHADSLHLLGVTHLQRAEIQEAERWIRMALERNPLAAPYWNNLGEALRRQQRLDEARRCFGRAIELAPDYADAHNNQGNVHSEEGDYAAAVRCYEQAVAIAPQLARGWYNLGSAYRRLKQFEKGVAALQRALAIEPRYADAWNNLGLVHDDMDDRAAAEAAFRKAVECDPGNADAQGNLGNVLLLRNKLDDALPLLIAAWAHRSGNHMLRLALAMAHAAVGEAERASELLAALDVSQLPPDAHGNALFVWNYDASLSAAELARRYRSWGERHASARNALPAFGARTQSGPLRIGYVSGDFNNHAVKNFLLPLLEHHDRQRFRVFAYSNSTLRDESTRAFELAVDVWRDIARMADREVALLVRRDEIDLLVDLSGHTRGNRLTMFSHRGAPVQASWLGYGCTTGVTAVDYYIGDGQLTPPGCEAAFTEQLARLDRPSLVYRPPVALAPGEPPSLRTGQVTFGSLSRVIRINAQVLDAWARILHRVRHSRLLLNQPILENQLAREAIWSKLEGRGIGRERVVLQHRVPHWLSYAEDIDVALDPFPHNAGTTTFESLWMGVPVVSMRARPPMGRYGDMILDAIGRPDWVADGVDDYVEIAVALAADPKALAALRGQLRDELKTSPLMDERGFCRSMEQLFERLHAAHASAGLPEPAALPEVAGPGAGSSPDAYAARLEQLLLLNQPAQAHPVALEFVAKWPQEARAHMGLGMVLRQLGRSDAGIAAYREALRLDPTLLVARLNLGRALGQGGKFEEAAKILAQAVQLHPQSATANSLLSWSLHFLERYEEATAAARAAIELDAKNTDAWQNLGNALRSAGKTTQAAEAYSQVIVLDPNNLDARTCLGSVLKDRAQYPLAREVYEEGLRRSATADDAIWTNYFFALNYDPDLSAAEIAQRYQEWGVRTSAAVKRLPPAPQIDRDPERRLRIGLVSADFSRHAIRFFVYPWLDAIDRQRFHWTLYSNTRKEDAETESFKRKADRWRDVRWKSDEEVAALIRSDEIDILIDLSGHTAGHRLFAFAAKPAPVQIATLGTGYTTGLDTIDYFLADARFVPPDAGALFAEKILRLPMAPFVYQPELPGLSVCELPARRNGFVTFGCLSRTVRLNRRVISAWVRILERLPGARLRLDHPQVIDPEMRASLEQQFQAGGIDLGRVDLVSAKPHWLSYDQIDIALDPFPHNAGTTTIEALWKGVPVVTLAGRPSLGRFGDTFMNAVGLCEWVAADEDDYVRKAVEAAGDLDALALLRSRLRQRLEHSSLMDGKGFALHLERALRQVWQAFCAGTPCSDIEVPPVERDAAWVNAKLAAGTTYLKSRELASARFFFEQILKFNPREVRTWLNLGACLRYEGKDREGLECFRRSTEIDPAYVAGWFNLGATLQWFKRHDEAEQAYLRVLALDAKHHQAWNNLGVICKEAMRADEALKCFKSALALCPDKASYLDNMGSLMERGDRLFEAKRFLERSLQCDPGYLSANANLGIVYRKLAMIDEAMAVQRRVPEATQINHPLLFTANYHPDITADELYRLYDQTCAGLNAVPRAHAAAPRAKTRLRVGFVGGDFRAHAAGKFLLPLFEHLDTRRLQPVIFANQARADAVSEKFRALAEWINVFEMSDAEFVARVQQEGIDILIDVAGWTNGSRLAAMAHKPAPVQISWLGYGYTTGLKAVDWFLGAPRYTPAGIERHFTERIYNLPVVPFCFDGLWGAPDVSALPSLGRGGLTFGCLSRTVRLNHRVIDLWSRLLREVKGSRLILDSKPFEDSEVCVHFRSRFEDHGVRPEQLLLRNSIPHWKSYADIDIALDPFPHNAGTTTIEALAMGVPSISLRARPPLGRFGDAILGAVGLDEWVVDSEDDYVQRACAAAENLQELSQLRSALRGRLMRSALCDHPRFARDFEAALFAIWDDAVQRQADVHLHVSSQ